jgi:hypothetical protein
MRKNHRPNPFLRRLAAIFAGLVVTAVPAMASDALLYATCVFHPGMNGVLFLWATL